MWTELFVALSLLMVVEGLLPSISPAMFRRVLINMAQMDDRSIRISGLISMVIGAVLLYILRH